MPCAIDQARLETAAAAIRNARRWHPESWQSIEDLLFGENERALYRINPVRFASERKLDPDEIVDLFLHCTQQGLFNLSWHMLCPGCGDIVTSFKSLETIHVHYHCDLCQHDFDATLDDYIEVSFTVCPDVRQIPFHQPETLSAEDYYFECEFSRDAIVPSGQPYVDIIRQQLVALDYIEAGATRTFLIEVGGGDLVGCDRLNNVSLAISVSGDPSTKKQIINLELDKSGFAPVPDCLKAGKMEFRINNNTNSRGSFFLLHIPSGSESPSILYMPFLSGKRLLNTQTFRELFGAEVMRATDGIAVQNITILFTDLKGSTKLYDRVGDLQAFSLVQQHFGTLYECVANHHGAIVKTIGDAVMASFDQPSDAAAAALAMVASIGRFNRRVGERDLAVKIGFSSGPAIAVTQNDRIDYFGRTINIAARIQSVAHGGEVCLPESIAAQTDVANELAGFPSSVAKELIRGLDETIEIRHVSAAHSSKNGSVSTAAPAGSTLPQRKMADPQ
ncbi:MAG: DUF5939 domain-containing protein, partial [Pseudomonadota bacterium]